MYKSLQEHVTAAQDRRDGEERAAERRAVADTFILKRVKEAALKESERQQLRQELFGQFVTGAATLGKLLHEGGVKPDVTVHKPALIASRGKRLLSGWAIEEKFYQGHAAGTHYEIDGLARSPNAVSYDALPASIEQLVVTPDQGLVRYTGVPLGLKPAKDGIHHGPLVVKNLDIEQMSGASLAETSNSSPDHYLAWLANSIVQFDVDPGQFGLPTYEPRHALAE